MGAIPMDLRQSYRRYGYGWITVAFFLLTIVGHWLFGWFAYAEDQRAHQQPVEVSVFFIEMGRDTLENWQSEFLQLLWQVGGLAFLLFVGSPQSKEGDDRREEKLDIILRRLEGPEAAAIIADLDRQYPRTQSD
jgi:lysylphosphatidylglycerol synthetase-like protein (DUF2156 family)